ncbi:hypothetical protein FOYG_16788 [Fusarium oxysporum NRRL 32931]|uniref:Uncharacterized protein n=2 Tax=Fusarium oxysporum TaxID=5507 RepID=W9HKZ8_FUSOX|nr:hypothetical protein FOYG_16788 [Fusarium oxysporum NRRL 32931]EWZ29049.1 hypothetical protein FOZG_17338 [Fusarium oxysporum Fo47]
MADHREQAEELIAKFIPPLPDDIEDEGSRQQRNPVTMPNLTRGSGTSTVGNKIMKGDKRRRTTSDRLEAGLAVGETRLLDSV